MSLPQTCLEFGVAEGQTYCDGNCNLFKCQYGTLVYVGRCGTAGTTCTHLSNTCLAGAEDGFQCCDGNSRMECVVPTTDCGSPYWTEVGTCNTTACSANSDGCPSLGNGIECCGVSRTRWKCTNGTWVDQNNDCAPVGSNLCNDTTRVWVQVESSPGGVDVGITSNGGDNTSVVTGSGTWGMTTKCLLPGNYTFTYSKSGYITQNKQVTIYAYDIYSEVPIEVYTSLVSAGGNKCPSWGACPESGFYTNCCDYGDVYECNPDKTWHYAASGGCGCEVGNNLCQSGESCNEATGTCDSVILSCPSCPSGQHCSGSATSYACVPDEVTGCTPNGAYRCNANVSELCTGSGGWIPQATCGTSNPCDTSTGKCSTAPAGCSPTGAFRCYGGNSQICNGTAGWATNATCGTSNPCDTSTGKCLSASTVCSAANPNGTCTAGLTCVNGVCTSVSHSCSTTYPSGTCPAGMTCVNGVCTATTHSCSTTYPTGTCPSGRTCSAGVCVLTTTSSVCTNGTTQCKPGNSNVAQSCTGGQWVDKACTNGCNAITTVCNTTTTSGTTSTCSGMNRNGSLDVSCILEPQNSTLLYGAIIGAAALILLAKR